MTLLALLANSFAVAFTGLLRILVAAVGAVAGVGAFIAVLLILLAIAVRSLVAER